MPNAKEWREGIGNVVEAVVGDNITKQQDEVACANMVCFVVGGESPDSIGGGWEGGTLTGGLGG